MTGGFTLQNNYTFHSTLAVVRVSNDFDVKAAKTLSPYNIASFSRSARKINLPFNSRRQYLSTSRVKRRGFFALFGFWLPVWRYLLHLRWASKFKHCIFKWGDLGFLKSGPFNGVPPRCIIIEECMMMKRYRCRWG